MDIAGFPMPDVNAIGTKFKSHRLLTVGACADYQRNIVNIWQCQEVVQGFYIKTVTNWQKRKKERGREGGREGERERERERGGGREVYLGR